jgi:hypothetical protein
MEDNGLTESFCGWWNYCYKCPSGAQVSWDPDSTTNFLEETGAGWGGGAAYVEGVAVVDVASLSPQTLDRLFCLLPALLGLVWIEERNGFVLAWKVGCRHGGDRQ